MYKKIIGLFLILGMTTPHAFCADAVGGASGVPVAEKPALPDEQSVTSPEESDDSYAQTQSNMERGALSAAEDSGEEETYSVNAIGMEDSTLPPATTAPASALSAQLKNGKSAAIIQTIVNAAEYNPRKVKLPTIATRDQLVAYCAVAGTTCSAGVDGDDVPIVYQSGKTYTQNLYYAKDSATQVYRLYYSSVTRTAGGATHTARAEYDSQGRIVSVDYDLFEARPHRVEINWNHDGSFGVSYVSENYVKSTATLRTTNTSRIFEEFDTAGKMISRETRTEESYVKLKKVAKIITETPIGLLSTKMVETFIAGVPSRKIMDTYGINSAAKAIDTTVATYFDAKGKVVKPAVSALKVSAITSTSAAVTFKVPLADQLGLQPVLMVAVKGTNNWVAVPLIATSSVPPSYKADMTGLNPNTKYEYSVQLLDPLILSLLSPTETAPFKALATKPALITTKKQI
ncbi:MAG TPA: hypothetical protein DIS66_03615 [Candidatus Omnitrophica bacterium]|nr:hypothetical protein [Candidatus Omnitrophota bacterium]